MSLPSSSRDVESVAACGGNKQMRCRRLAQRSCDGRRFLKKKRDCPALSRDSLPLNRPLALCLFVRFFRLRFGIFPADVHIQTDGTRPRVRLHRSGDESDALVIDQHEGISIARAQQLAEQALHGIQA